MPDLCRSCFAILSYIFCTQNAQVRLFFVFLLSDLPLFAVHFSPGRIELNGHGRGNLSKDGLPWHKSWVFRPFVWCLILVKTASLLLWKTCRKISSISFISPVPSPEYFWFSDMKDCLLLLYVVFQVSLLILDNQYRIIFISFAVFEVFLELVMTLRGDYWEGGRVQIFGNNVNKSKFYSGRN